MDKSMVEQNQSQRQMCMKYIYSLTLSQPRTGHICHNCTGAARASRAERRLEKAETTSGSDLDSALEAVMRKRETVDGVRICLKSQ